MGVGAIICAVFVAVLFVKMVAVVAMVVLVAGFVLVLVITAGVFLKVVVLVVFFSVMDSEWHFEAMLCIHGLLNKILDI